MSLENGESVSADTDSVRPSLAPGDRLVFLVPSVRLELTLHGF